MWYNSLDRSKPYLRSYRNQNLWMRQQDERLRGPRVLSMHINIFRRIAKTYAGHRIVCFIWGTTFMSALFAFNNIKKVQLNTGEQEKEERRILGKLHTIHQKNKFGFHTRIFSDFDLLLQSILNEKFIQNSSNYYDDPVSGPEIQDVENGLNSDLSHEDVRSILRDKGGDHHAQPKCFVHPSKHSLNYDKNDELSVYKVLPKGVKAKY